MVPWVRNPTVVIADDDSLIRFVLRAALERSGFDVIDAEDGQVAARVAASEAVDAVVLDARMPGLTLSETIARLRSDRPHLPVLILSGQVRAPDEADAPHTTFLSKPVDSTTLVETLNRLVGIGSG